MSQSLNQQLSLLQQRLGKMSHCYPDPSHEINLSAEVQSLIQQLRKMSDCCPDPSVDPKGIKERYTTVVSGMDRTAYRSYVPSKYIREYLNFMDCNLSDAHIKTLFEILSKSRDAYQESILMLGGEQNFSQKILAENIIKMLEANPNAIYRMHLPGELRTNKEIRDRWNVIIGADRDRCLIYDGAAPFARAAEANAGDPGAGGRPGMAGAGGAPADPGAGGRPGMAGAGGAPADPGAGGRPGMAGAGGAPADPGAGGRPKVDGDHKGRQHKRRHKRRH